MIISYFPVMVFLNIPDLAIGRAGWDNWMIYEARRNGWPVVETTPTYMVIHQQHDYSHLPGGKPHYRHPESDENVRLAGGRHAIYTLADVNYQLKDGRLVKIPLTWKKFWREIEIFPTTGLKKPSACVVLAGAIPSGEVLLAVKGMVESHPQGASALKNTCGKLYRLISRECESL